MSNTTLCHLLNRLLENPHDESVKRDIKDMFSSENARFIEIDWHIMNCPECAIGKMKIQTKADLERVLAFIETVYSMSPNSVSHEGMKKAISLFKEILEKDLPDEPAVHISSEDPIN